jgi:hypothetical protein
MKHIDDIQRDALKKAREKYNKECKEIREGFVRYHLCEALGERAEKFFKGCVVYSSEGC